MYGNLLKALHYHVAKKAYPRYIPSSVKTMTKEPMFFDDFFFTYRAFRQLGTGKVPNSERPTSKLRAAQQADNGIDCKVM